MPPSSSNDHQQRLSRDIPVSSKPAPDPSASNADPQMHPKPTFKARKNAKPLSNPDASFRPELDGRNQDRGARTPNPPPKQKKASQKDRHKFSGHKNEDLLSESDLVVIAMWELKRLPFLPRVLRRGLEPFFEQSLGHPVILGMSRAEANERFVCPVCPVFGFFSHRDARDLHVKHWHADYHKKMTENHEMRAGPAIAPLQARFYVPDPPVKKPPQGLHFPHISERTTGLRPMPDFGYMRDRVRYEEMRVLARPGPRQIFSAAWKRWIFEHRQDFIAKPVPALCSFLHEYAEPVRLAGKDVLKAWLLALVNQNLLSQFEFVDVYGGWAKAEREHAERLSPEA